MEELLDNTVSVVKKKITLRILKNKEFSIFMGVIFLTVLMSVFNERFFTPDNLLNITRQVSINGILAVGMTMVILTGGIDLSVGSIMALSGTIIAGCMVKLGMSPVMAVFFGILLGGTLGLTNGILISYANLPPIIVTLAMMEIPRGLALLYTGGYPLSGLPDGFSFLGRGYLFNLIPMPVVIMAIIYLVIHVFLNYYPAGRYIYAIGGNEEAVKLSGIKVKKYKMLVYSLSGIISAITGVVLTSRLMSGQPNAGVGFELDAIAAVVLGGASIKGGKGSVIGTFLGALMLGILSNGLNLMGISPYVQRVVKGLIIIVAIYIGSRGKK